MAKWKRKKDCFGEQAKPIPGSIFYEKEFLMVRYQFFYFRLQLAMFLYNQKFARQFPGDFQPLGGTFMNDFEHIGEDERQDMCLCF